uniref:Peptidase_M1 domain-containing protein n=1 Tax=Heterorhabditis bacteriophora TaxID=37862 RepID=A0A1I7XCR8_HETBA
MIEDVQIINDKWQKTIFAPTPSLPAYLISFSVMPNSYIQLSRQTSFGVTVRVNAASHVFALRVLNIALISFELLATIMEVPLPLNKINFILVPFYDGGMENWGHVLLSESLASTGDDAHLIYVVAHELAHHWVGGKTTIKSWQYICLQEDLTDFLAFKVVRALLNEDDRYNRFRLAKYVEIQLAEDFLSVGHSLVMPEQITKETEEVDNFQITSHCYLKGVIMLETLESVVGEEYMFSTIKKLVSTQQFLDLSTFLHHFNKIKLDANTTLAEVYRFWFIQGGFPSLLVENKGSSYLIRQTSAVTWPLRLSSTFSKPRFLFAESMALHETKMPFFINLNFTSFMRVNYDLNLWESIFRVTILFQQIKPLLIITTFILILINVEISQLIRIFIDGHNS